MSAVSSRRMKTNRLIFLGTYLLLQGQVSFAEEPLLDTAARPVNSGSSAAPTGAPLPGTSVPGTPLRVSPPPKPTSAPTWRPATFKKRVYACTFPIRHPKKAFDKLVFPVVHPLQFGKACESSGANGLLGFAGGLANVGTTAILGARRF